MSAAFLKKFFPIGKTLKLRQEITTFQQAENEQFYKAWKRYGDLIRKCPHHDIPKWQLVQSFYSGLLLPHRVMVDASCGGSVMVKSEEEAWQLFETMSEGSLQNVSFERRGESVTTGSDKPQGMYEIKPSHDLNSKVEILTEKVNAAQGYANARGFSQLGNDPYSSTYNAAAYRSQNRQAPTQSSRDPSFEDKVLQALNRFNDTQQQVRSNTWSILRLETQVGQIANALNRREEGRLPSQPIQPPGGQFVVHDPPLADAKESSQSKEGTPPVTPTSPTSVSADSKVPPYVPKAPFPSCLNAPSPFPKREVSMEDTLEVFKQVIINIPLLDAIKQVPTYAKFLKDLCTQKRKNRTNVSKKVLLTEQVSSVFQSDAPLKMQDPGTLTINIVIRRHAIERALLDLGASVNLIRYSVYEQLGLGELKPTSVTLQLADRSIKVLCGVVEDVLLKVNDFYFPAYFIVIDTEPVQPSKSRL
ncbi:uncharacterized protein LOC131323727 [Rhododendron vialii]|uniref:uncharacterized protein LOC131323727 n=1 Tax=Rhododendron vialii TaxID=182163 RepID=UPI00265F0523|nr:uncharacterized protein LOC131323727 [Rhododendron vialii]